MRHAMEAIYKNDKPFHNRLNVLENKTVVVVKAAFNALWALKTRINYHDEDIDILEKIPALFDHNKQETMKSNNNHLPIKMLTKAFTAYIDSCHIL